MTDPTPAQAITAIESAINTALWVGLTADQVQAICDAAILKAKT